MMWKTYPAPGRRVFENPLLTLILGHVATRGKRHSKERQKSWRNCVDHFLGQVRSKVRPPKIKFCRVQHFSTNRLITREPEEAQRRGKAPSIALLTLFRTKCPKVRSTVWSPESKNWKITVFKKTVFLYHFHSVKTWHSFCQCRVSLVKTRRMNYDLTLESHVKNLTSG